MASLQQKKILGASLGHCVHVAGILNFLNVAEKYDYTTHFLGPAISVEKLTSAILDEGPDIIALSYRLTPAVLKELLASLQKEIERNSFQT